MSDTMQHAGVALDPALQGERLPLDAIPIVDLGPFRGRDAAARRAVALDLGRAAHDIGFVYIVNHGVPASLIERTFAEAKRFFDLPLEQKLSISIKKSPCHRGYFAEGEENLDPGKQVEAGDFKEGIKIGRDLPPDHPDVRAGLPLHGPNQWPKDIPGLDCARWRATMEEYYRTMVGLGRELMRAFALALELDERFFDDKLTAPMATAGPLHYRPQYGQITEKRLGAGAHTDFGCLTMLAQDETGGLQVRNAAGKWIAAPVIPGSFVVNIGDMLARWTNDLFASTQHRVINTSGRDRYSIPFFFDPNFEAEVACLPTCVSAERPARYPPTTGGQHLIDMINATFEYRGKAKARYA